MLGEDVQDERRAVNDLCVHDVLECAALRGRELGIDDHGIRAGRGDDLCELGGLTRAKVRGRVRDLAALEHSIEHLRARRLGKRSKLTQRFLASAHVAVGHETCKNDSLKSQLAVLNLGDVRAFGRQPGNSPQR